MKVPVEYVQAIMLAAFAVIAGQIAQLGSQASEGKKLNRPRILIQLSTLPAAAALIGAYGAENNWPIFYILTAGVVAGWLGFGAVALVVEVAVRAFRGAMGLPQHPRTEEQRPKTTLPTRKVNKGPGDTL